MNKIADYMYLRESNKTFIENFIIIRKQQLIATLKDISSNIPEDFANKIKSDIETLKEFYYFWDNFKSPFDLRKIINAGIRN